MIRSSGALLGACIALPAFACVFLLGCVAPPDGSSSAGSGGTTSDAGSEGGATSAAGQACLDTADAFAKARARCGEDYAGARANFIRDLANGDCNAVSIRNERELRSGCFASLARISCADLVNGRYDPTCAEQIIRSR